MAQHRFDWTLEEALEDGAGKMTGIDKWSFHRKEVRWNRLTLSGVRGGSKRSDNMLSFMM